MAAYIERQIANRQFTFTLIIMAAQQRADAGVQFLQGEGFNQIIICADIQPGNAVIERIAGGQNEYRQGVFFLSDSRQEMQAILIRQPYTIRL